MVQPGDGGRDTVAGEGHLPGEAFQQQQGEGG